MAGSRPNSEGLEGGARMWCGGLLWKVGVSEAERPSLITNRPCQCPKFQWQKNSSFPRTTNVTLPRSFIHFATLPPATRPTPFPPNSSHAVLSCVCTFNNSSGQSAECVCAHLLPTSSRRRRRRRTVQPQPAILHLASRSAGYSSVSHSQRCLPKPCPPRPPQPPQGSSCSVLRPRQQHFVPLESFVRQPLFCSVWFQFAPVQTAHSSADHVLLHPCLESLVTNIPEIPRPCRT